MLISNFRSEYHQRFDGAKVIRRPIQLDLSPSHRLPHHIDLRQWMTPIVNQGETNLCSAAAFAGACEYLIKRYTGQYIPISQLFIYFNGRLMDHGIYRVEDQGASRRNVLKGMRRFGICNDKLWPFKKRLLNKKPSDSVYFEAKRYTVASREIPLDITALKTCLANQIPALIGMKIKHCADNVAGVNGGYLSIPHPNDTELAYTNTHAVLLVGYNDKSQHFIVRNSWGSHWGDYGYFYMPYDYLLDNRLVNHQDCAWAITRVSQRSNHLSMDKKRGVPRHHYNPRRQ